jgi:peptide/nickel transport system substrate-binding protein
MKRIPRRRLLGAATGAASASALLLIACGGDGGTSAPAAAGQGTAQPAQGAAATAGPPTGSATVGIPSLGDESVDLSHFNVGTHLHQMLLVNDTLVRRELDGKIGPALAVRWRSNESGWEFDLDPNAKFHNSEPVTASDVAFSVERILEFPKAWAGPDLRPVLKSVEPIDERTVRFNTSKPFPLLLHLAWSIGPMPRAYFKAVGEEKATAEYVGSGPFRLVRRAPGQSMTFEAVENFYNLARRPRVKEITLRIMPDASTRLAALRASEIDVADLDFGQLRQVRGSTDVSVVESKAARAFHLVMAGLGTSDPPSPLKDQRVREALLLALDRKSIVEQLFAGAGEPMITGFLPSTPGFRSDLKPHPFDATKAKQLLTAAGYGSGLEIALNSGGETPSASDELAAVASYWQKIGVNTKINVKDTVVYLESVRKREITGAGTLAYSAGVSGIDGVKLWNAYYACGVDYNGSNWCNTSADEILAKAQVEMDEPKRIALLQQLNKTIYDELPVLPRYYLSGVYGAGRKVKKLEFPSGWVYYGGHPLETLELRT